MCDVVDLSDDDSFFLESDDEVMPKDENLAYDMPPQNTHSRSTEGDVASSSGTNLRSSFIGMGFAPSLVDKAIEENGEGNGEGILESLFAYSKPKTEVLDSGFSCGHNDSSAANLRTGEEFHKSESSDPLCRLFGENTMENAYCESDIPIKVEHDAGDSVIDEKTKSLLKMNFSLDEVGFAMQRLGKAASIGQLMDFIFAARMARKYERDTNNSIPGSEANGKDCNNEVLFGIMEKTLQLLEMGFSENDISEAFDRCGSETTAALLAESIITGGTCPLPVKSTSTQRSFQALKRKMGEGSSFCIKTEENTSDGATQVETSDLLEKLKGKIPEVDIDEPTNFKKPKEEFMEELGNSDGRMLLEARIGYPSVSNPAPVRKKRAGHIASILTSIEEDRKPSIFLPKPCRSLNNVVAKPPYFLYGNVTHLSVDSWAKVSQFLYSVQPEFVDSQSFSALNRREGYVHNLPSEDRSHIFPKGPMTLAEAIPYSKKFWPSWDSRKHLSNLRCESTGLLPLCERLRSMLPESNAPPSKDVQSKILQQCVTKSLVWVGNRRLSPLEPEHLEHIMGYPQHHTRIAGYSSTERLNTLRLSFQTDTLAYHLSVLKRLYPGGVTMMSFFSGIGGAEIAIHRLGIRLKGVVSVESCETKRRMVKKWWENSGQSGELIQLEDIHKLSTSKLEDLFKRFKGFDLLICQNPYKSGADCENLTGLDFSFFVEFVRVLQCVRSTMARNG